VVVMRRGRRGAFCLLRANGHEMIDDKGQAEERASRSLARYYWNA
jgi:hypothetical protein